MSWDFTAFTGSGGILALPGAQLDWDWMTRSLEALTTPVSLAIFAAGLLGLVVGCLVARRGGVESAPTSDASELPELRWRHEKLVLTERQMAERRVRLDQFARTAGGDLGPEQAEARARCFALSERIRDARHETGSDLSRYRLIEERLAAVAEGRGATPEAVSGSLAVVRSQLARLKETRERLRSLGEAALPLLEGFLQTPRVGPAEAGQLRLRLEELGSALTAGSGHEETEEADALVRRMLDEAGVETLGPVRSVLLVDGASTKSLRSEDDFARAAENALISLARLEGSGDPDECARRVTAAARAAAIAATSPIAPSAIPASPPAREAASPAQPPRPDTAFRPAPAATAPVKARPAGGSLPNGKGIRDLSESPAPAQSGPPPAEPLVIFRSNDASLWGRDVYRGANHRARPLGEMPPWAKWISIRRLDTGERVFAPADSACFSKGDPGLSFGFNGSNELFYGARHLGLFSESCPNEVETRFTYGGWGFGHRVGGPEEGSRRPQASGWEGREIPEDTVFEIALHAELPDLNEADRVLGGSPA